MSTTEVRCRWRLFLVLGLLLVVSGLLLVPKVRWSAYGWLRGEAFYQGRPASYWRDQVQRHFEAKARGSVEIPWIAGVLDDLGAPVSIDNPLDMPEVLRPDPSAIPVLIDLLQEDDEQVCLAACDALGDIGADAQAAVPALLKMLQDPRRSYRESASFALRAIGADDKAIPILVTALDDDAALVAYNSALVLGKLGSRAEVAVPALTRVLQSEGANRRVRPSSRFTVGNGVATALQQIDPEAAAKAGVE